MRRVIKLFVVLVAGLFGLSGSIIPAWAGYTISAEVNQRPLARTTLEQEGPFQLKVPLERNRVNQIYIRVRDENGRELVKGPFSVTQLSLESIVIAKATSERLTTEEVEELVQQGVIKLEDPANWHVSRFTIQLNIGSHPIKIRRTVAYNKNNPEEIVEEEKGGPIEILYVYDRLVPSKIKIPKIEIEPVIISSPKAPPIPALLIIDGRLKTLKEFFKVKLLIANTSELFTLKEVQAVINCPTGLSLITPESGRNFYPEIKPGQQDEKQWIVRGDKIGHYKVRLDFAGLLSGPGVPEPVPITGSADTSLEVKGPPQLKVLVEHPSEVEAGEPYELYVRIANVDTIPAHYASLTLTLGGDIGRFENENGPLSEERELGHIMPGQTVVQSFKIYPSKSGRVQSCVSAATPNIQLLVQAGDVPCPSGTIPFEAVEPSEKTTVWVVPPNNTSDVALDARPVIYFSRPVEVEALTTGFEGASIVVADEYGNIVPGELRIVFEAPDGTVGIAFYHDQQPFAPSTTYYISVSSDILDARGEPIASGLISSFTTKRAEILDQTPPSLELTWEGDYEVENIRPGEVLKVRAVAGDDSGLERLECYLDGNFLATDNTPPYLFAIETSGLAPQTRHTILVRAYDLMGNYAEASLDFWTAEADHTPPEITKFLLSPTPVLKGQKLLIEVEAHDDSLLGEARFYLDDQTEPFASLPAAPFIASLDTSSLAIGEHILRIEIQDVHGNEQSQEKTFSILQDTVAPNIEIKAPATSPQLVQGDYLAVQLGVTDNVGVSKIEAYLDDNEQPAALGKEFVISTSDLSPGKHSVRIKAYDVNGNVNEKLLFFTVLAPPPPDTTPPPLEEDLIKITFSREDSVIIRGEAGATEGLALIDVIVGDTGAVFSRRADQAGAFYLVVEAFPGQKITLQARDAAGNLSTPLTITLPGIEGLSVTPASLEFVDRGQSQFLGVKLIFSDGSKVSPLLENLHFESANPDIAVVSKDGRVTALADGETVIRIQHLSGLEAEVPVNVNIRQPIGLSLEPDYLTFKEKGERHCLNLILTYSDGSRRYLYQNYELEITDPNLVAINGLCFTALAEGEATVHVTYGGFNAAATLSSHFRKLDHLEASPATINFTRTGQKVTLQVFAVYDDGYRKDITRACTYTSSAPGVAAVSTYGVVVAGNTPGETEITISYPGVAALKIPVTFEPAQPVALVVSPTWIHFTQIGESTRLTVNYQLSDGGIEPASYENLSFIVQNEEIVAVDAQGYLTAVQPGETTITVEDTAYGLPPVTVTVVVETEGAIPEEAPELHYLGRYQAARGDLLGLIGKNFSVYPSLNQVYIDGQRAEVIKAFPTYLVVRVPENVSSGEVEVYVEVGGRETVHHTLYVFPHIARAIYLGGPLHLAGVDIAWTLWKGKIWFEPGDKVYLSRAVNKLLPPEIEGRLYARINGTLHEINFQEGEVPELSAFLQPGANQVEFIIQSAEVVGPVEEVATITVPGTAMPLEDAGLGDGTPPVEALTLAAGEKVIIYAEGTVNWRYNNSYSYTDPNGGGAVGPICGSRPYPADGPILRLMGAFNGELYDLGAGPVVFTAPEDGTLYLGLNDCLYADNTGAYTVHFLRAESGPGVTMGRLYLIYGPENTGVLSGEYHFFADGLARPYTLVLENLRDVNDAPLPDGTRVAVTARSYCSLYDLDSDGDLDTIWSAGGEIIGGEAATGGQCYQYARIFTVENGKVTVVYSNNGMALAAGEEKIARVQFLPVDRQNRVASNRAFAVVEVPLLGPAMAHINLSQNEAVAGPAPSEITFEITDVRDLAGNPVPDGTRVAVTARSYCSLYDLDSDGDLDTIWSAGGEIIGGEAATGGQCYRYARIFTVENGKVVGTYSTAGLDLSGYFGNKTARLQVLAADQNGRVLGNRALAVAEITLYPPDFAAAEAAVNPPSLTANGQDQRAQVTLYNLRNVLGNPVPDGTRVAVTARSYCSLYDLDSDGDLDTIWSAGGEIIGGEAATGGQCYQYARIFTVENGEIDVTYSAQGITLATGEVKYARLQFLPANDLGNVLSSRALQVVEIPLAGLASGEVTLPAEGYYDSRVTFVLDNVKDALDQLAPDGTPIAVTVKPCSAGAYSAGGEIIGGEEATDGNGWCGASAFKIFYLSGGQITGEILLPSTGEKVTLQFFPATPEGDVVGNEPFAIGVLQLIAP